MSVVNSYNLTKSQEKLIQPTFGGFQLIGDSLFVRFADQILQSHRNTPGTSAVGHCVSGQRIDQLRHRIKLKLYPLSSKVMVLIGTNDVLCGGNICTMIKHFNSLLNILQKSVENILILTLPPIPRFCITYFHWNLIREYNSYLISLGDGRNVTVADICPIFTKFKGALEYDIPAFPIKISEIEPKKAPTLRSSSYFEEEEQNEKVNQVKKRKSLLDHRRKCFLKQRNFFGMRAKLSINLDRSESDYRNTTDTNTSADSEILSSELSQERDNFQKTIGLQDATNIQEKPNRSSPKAVKNAETPPAGYIKRTLESVFGKDVLRRRKTEMEQKKSKIAFAGQPEKRPRKNPIDLNENLRATDSWQVESDEDSMKDHVYKSQEEIEYDVVEVGSQKKKKSGEFSKFCESFNENDKTPKKNFCHRKLIRENLRNERSENAESSSSSDVEIPKKQLRPYIDHNFRYFFEKSIGENDCSMDSNQSFCSSPEWGIKPFNHSDPTCSPVGINRKGRLTPNLRSPIYGRRSLYKNFFDFSKGFKKVDGVSERDKLILQLANKICHLQFYELFYSFRRKRMDMVHLNHHGLTELKNFLIANNYVSI